MNEKRHLERKNYRGGKMSLGGGQTLLESWFFEKFKVKTAELQESSFQAMSCQMETFRQKLEEFARTHKDEIKIDLTQTHLYVSSATSDKEFCQGTSIYDVKDSLSNGFSLKYQITVQSRFSDITFSDNLYVSDYFSKTIFQFTT